MECNTGDAAQAEDGAQKSHQGVILTITHYRRRLADPDGLCPKYLIDCCVSAGLLPDDNAKEIADFRQKQIKVARQEDEKTVVDIEDVE